MWKAVGSLNPSDNKQNRSKDETNCQPFAQASRLRLNESHLSGQRSHQFMNEYFTKRRSPEGSLQRALSQKTIELKEATLPHASLRQIQPMENANKLQMKISDFAAKQGSLNDLQRSIEAQVPRTNFSDKYQKIKEELKSVRQWQKRMNKLVVSEVETFKQEVKLFQTEISQKVGQMELERDKNSRQNINPELLAKIKHQGARFNEKMRELDARKDQLKAKYKDRYRTE